MNRADAVGVNLGRVRRPILLLTAAVALALVSSACASDLDPALSGGGVEVTRDELTDQLEDVVELREATGVQIPLLTAEATTLEGTQSTTLAAQILSLHTQAAVLDEAIEQRDLSISDEGREAVDALITTQLGVPAEQTDTEIGRLWREFLIERQLVADAVGFYEPTEDELEALYRAFPEPRIDRDDFLNLVFSVAQQDPVGLLIAVTSVTSGPDFEVDPRYGTYSPIGAAVEPREASVGLPPGFRVQ